VLPPAIVEQTAERVEVVEQIENVTNGDRPAVKTTRKPRASAKKSTAATKTSGGTE
jgi:hypothetical protein